MLTVTFPLCFFVYCLQCHEAFFCNFLLKHKFYFEKTDSSQVIPLFLHKSSQVKKNVWCSKYRKSTARKILFIWTKFFSGRFVKILICVFSSVLADYRFPQPYKQHLCIVTINSYNLNNFTFIFSLYCSRKKTQNTRR